MTKRFLRRLRARDERGFTITEVTLTLLILSIVMLVAFDFLDRTSLLTYRTDAHGQAEQDTQQALRIVTQHTRGASPIGDPCTTTTDMPPPASGGLVQGTLPAGYSNCLRLTVPRTTVGLDTCAKTEFVFALVPVSTSPGGTLATTYLVENRRETTGTTSACTTGTWRQRRILMKNVANDGTQPLFTYYAADGSAVSTTAAIKQAKSVKVTLANRFRKTAPPLVMHSTVAVRNNISR